MDLPSRGDTCFAAQVPSEDPDEVVLYNYSSDIVGPDVAWSVGQRRPTYIYRHVLRFHDDAREAGPAPSAPAAPPRLGAPRG
jgi:hypothetical protein